MRISDVSANSTMNVDRPRASSSDAPILEGRHCQAVTTEELNVIAYLVKMPSKSELVQESAGTWDPIWAMRAMRATDRLRLLLPVLE